MLMITPGVKVVFSCKGKIEVAILDLKGCLFDDNEVRSP